MMINLSLKECRTLIIVLAVLEEKNKYDSDLGIRLSRIRKKLLKLAKGGKR